MHRSSINEMTDEQLLDLVRESDRSAFTLLYERHWRPLFSVAAHKLGDPEVAEEIAQDIFANIWYRRQTLRLQFTFRTYLSAALKYKIIDQLARQQVRKRHAEQTPFSETDDSTQQWLDFEELQDRLAALVRELPEKCRIVYQLREQGLSYREIADELDITEKTVESHLGKATRTIRSKLGIFASIFI